MSQNILFIYLMVIVSQFTQQSIHTLLKLRCFSFTAAEKSCWMYSFCPSYVSCHLSLSAAMIRCFSPELCSLMMTDLGRLPRVGPSPLCAWSILITPRLVWVRVRVRVSLVFLAASVQRKQQVAHLQLLPWSQQPWYCPISSYSPSRLLFQWEFVISFQLPGACIRW